MSRYRCRPARRPKLIIVDELAHSNAPDSRHPKRYQDVEELIGAGIDVWTALNIQHLESLVDVVSRITGVIVRESVPDSVIKKADEVIVVDITPTELIQRLEAGKVYCRRMPGVRPMASSSPAISPPCASWRCAAQPNGSTIK